MDFRSGSDRFKIGSCFHVGFYIIVTLFIKLGQIIFG